MLVIIFSLIGFALALFILKALIPWLTGIDELTNQVKGLREDLNYWKKYEDRSL